MVSVKSVLYNIFTSGKAREGRGMASEMAARYSILNSAHILGAVALSIFGYNVLFVKQDTTLAVLDFSMAAVCVLVVLLLRTGIPYRIPGTVSISAYGALCASFVYTWDLGGYASLWLYAFPLLAIFTLGIYLGVILSTLLFGAILVITLVPGLAAVDYTVMMSSRLCGSYALVASLTVIYELIRLTKDRNISELSEKLRQVERAEITAMKDSIKTGIFLMDKDLLIQPAYSKAMEKILGTNDILGRKLTYFLGSSLSKREMGALDKYFEMVLNRSFDTKMLEEINPIAEFVYYTYSEEKHLRSSFTAVDRGEGLFMILGTLDDVSNQVRLQKELEAEAARRDEEMKTIFQIVQLEPRAFKDFISYTEKEFDKVNDILKNNDMSSSADETMNAIFRRIHAIKSNALVLGMESFGNKLHELELEIRAIQNSGKVTFDDTLHTVVKLEAIMEEKDKYRKTIERISSFRESKDSPVSHKFVLIDTLTKICEKTGQTEGKDIAFISDDFDESILDENSLIIIKDTLAQLVRNAVAHGIETPSERKARGKNPKGKIHLSVKQVNNQIHIKVEDDGAGIDFDKIQKRAKSLNLITGDAPDKNTLLKLLFAPGISTADEISTTAGQGVGLDLVRDRITELHGSITVFSKKGKGTAFDMVLPSKKSK